METYLYLVIPENSGDEIVIREFYRYILKKRRETRPNRDHRPVEEMIGYQSAIETLEERDKFLVYEQLTTSVIEAVDWDVVREVFADDEVPMSEERIVCNEEKLSRLVEILRDGKAQLQREQPGIDWEISIEAGPIALCEFALEHGYCVKRG